MPRRHYLKLRRLIEDEGLKNEELAAQIGVHKNTISKHLCAPEDAGLWTSSEIIAICRVLHIPSEQIGEYFFPQIEKGEPHEQALHPCI